jgi:site-specific DNA-methyltransferase (adenine-specific)
VTALGAWELGRVHRVEMLAALGLPNVGAALGGLPSDSVDMLLTDPPYSSGGFTRGDRAADPAQKYPRDGSPDSVGTGRISFTGDNRDGRSWAYWCSLWLSECQRIVRPGGYAAMFTDWRQLPLATDAFQAGGFVWRGIFAWDKGEAARAPHPGYFRHQCEYLVWGTNGPCSAEAGAGRGPYPGCDRVAVRQDDKFHMTGKPTELMRRLVRVVPPGALVLDPFAGSGTTLVACELEGRVGLGFEREQENVDIANERIAAARDSIDAAAARQRQLGIFAAGERT